MPGYQQKCAPVSGAVWQGFALDIAREDDLRPATGGSGVADLLCRYGSFDNAVAIAGIELLTLCKPAFTSSGQCGKRVHSVKKPLRFSMLFQIPFECAPPRRSSSELAMVMISSEGDAGRGLPSATSGRLLASRMRNAPTIFDGLEARIAVRRERFERPARVIPVFFESFVMPRSSDNAECVSDVARQVEQTALGRQKCPEYHPPGPESNDCSIRSLGVVHHHNRSSAGIGGC